MKKEDIKSKPVCEVWQTSMKISELAAEILNIADESELRIIKRRKKALREIRVKAYEILAKTDALRDISSKNQTK
jgi:hypothetical protein|nr:MAG TPA: hypothetical protein [Crassvirales sp.]